MSTVLELIGRRDFDGKDVRATLDELSLQEVIVNLGSPHYVRRYRKPSIVHDIKPVLASDDPAVLEAMGRCSLARSDVFRVASPRLYANASRIHRPDECQWCEWPAALLVEACDYAVGTMKFLEDEMLVWYQHQDRSAGAKYIRVTRGQVYEHPAWASFWSMPTHERERRIASAMYGER